MYTCMLLWQPFDSTSVVSLAFFNLLEPFSCSGIMIRVLKSGCVWFFLYLFWMQLDHDQSHIF